MVEGKLYMQQGLAEHALTYLELRQVPLQQLYGEGEGRVAVSSTSAREGNSQWKFSSTAGSIHPLTYSCSQQELAPHVYRTGVSSKCAS